MILLLLGVMHDEPRRVPIDVLVKDNREMPAGPRKRCNVALAHRLKMNLKHRFKIECHTPPPGAKHLIHGTPFSRRYQTTPSAST